MHCSKHVPSSTWDERICIVRIWLIAAKHISKIYNSTVNPWLLVASLANTNLCNTPEKLKPWQVGTHLRVLSEFFL